MANLLNIFMKVIKSVKKLRNSEIDVLIPITHGTSHLKKAFDIMVV